MELLAAPQAARRSSIRSFRPRPPVRTASSFSSASLTQFAVIDDTVQIELYDMDRGVRYLVHVIDAADGEYVGRLVATTRGEERASIDMRVTCAFE